MAIQTIINDINFYNEFKNDIGFVSNLGDVTNNLSGSIMENMRVAMSVDISWKTIYAPQSGFNWDLTITGGIGTELIIVSNDGYNFENEGFSSGDTVFIGFNFSGIPVSINQNSVQFVNGNTMVIILSTPYVIIPGAIIGIAIYGTSWLTALNYKFGLNENGESYNTISKVSGNNQGFYSNEVGLDIGGGIRNTAQVDMIRVGANQDWLTGVAKVRFVSNPAPNVQRFIISHDFTIVPFYLDGQLSNLQNNILPTLFDGINTIKYVFDAGFRVAGSDPNTEKRFQIDNIDGSVGWFNENFNGFQNNYNIKSVVYQEAGSLIGANGILIGSKSRVTVTVEDLTGPFTGAERFGVYVSYLPSQTQYENTTLTDLKANFIYDRAINNEGLAPTVGSDFITLCESSIVSGEMVIVFEMEYSTAQKMFLANQFSLGNANYLLGIQIGDVTLSSVSSDRVMLLADAREYDQSADIPGLFGVDVLDIYTHNKQIGVDTGSTDVVSWVEDGLVSEFDFHLNLNQDAVINQLQFLLVAQNPITGTYFELDKFNVVVGTAIVSAGVQQINENTTRGYILKSADQFNDLIVEVGPNVGGIQHYTGRFAQKISWQDWIQNLNVDTIFYDLAKPNNNFNLKSSNYSDLNDYQIKLAISGNIDGVSLLGVSGNTDYLAISPSLTVYNYEEDGNITPVWGCVIDTFNNSNMADLGGAVMTGQDTLFRATWTNSGGPVASLVDIWGINRIEQTDQPGFAITEMSSLNLPSTTQILKPKSGFTLLDVYLDSGNVVMECLIDGTQVVPGIEYNLSARIQDENAIDPKAKLTSPDNTLKYTSGTIETKQEAP